MRSREELGHPVTPSVLFRSPLVAIVGLLLCGLQPAWAQPASPTLTTQASGPVVLGGSISDTATLAGGNSPTGTITFDLYAPGDVTCAGDPIFSSSTPVMGNGAYPSASFVAMGAGTYHWIATYSGDGGNEPAGPTSCADPDEQSLVTLATPTLSTLASGSVPAGGAIHDTATLAGGNFPLGTITFHLFAPSDPGCAGPPIFSSSTPVNGNGDYDSADFTAATVGTYRWTASYSGDFDNDPAGPTSCTDAAEAVAVTPANPTLTTQASGPASVGLLIHDTATLAGGVAPTGTITFDLFGPADPACAGTPVFSSSVPVSGNGDYVSASFTPAAAGTYRWVATYSGDANDNPAGPTSCDDAAEAVAVSAVIPALDARGLALLALALAAAGLLALRRAHPL